MSYTKTFNVAYALKGAAAKTVVYKVALTPVASNKSIFFAHYTACTKATITHCEGSLTIPQLQLDKAQPFGVAAIVGINNAAATAHELARGRPMAFGGSSCSFSSADAIGVNFVIKAGSGEPGDLPALHVAIGANVDTSGIDVGFLSMKITVLFEGESDAAAYEVGLPQMS